MVIGCILPHVKIELEENNENFSHEGNHHLGLGIFFQMIKDMRTTNHKQQYTDPETHGHASMGRAPVISSFSSSLTWKLSFDTLTTLSYWYCIGKGSKYFGSSAKHIINQQKPQYQIQRKSWTYNISFLLYKTAIYSPTFNFLHYGKKLSQYIGPKNSNNKLDPSPLKEQNCYPSRESQEIERGSSQWPPIIMIMEIYFYRQQRLEVFCIQRQSGINQTQRHQRIIILSTIVKLLYMQPQFMKVLVIILLVSIASTQFATPPTLTTGGAGGFATSGTIYKLSKRLEVFENSDDSTTTTIKYSSYNSSDPSKFNTKTTTFTGAAWDDVKITKDTLSCAVLYDGTSVYTLLKYDSIANTITKIESANHPIVAGDIPTLAIKQDCVGGYFGATPTLKIFSTPAATIPTGWVPITTSESLAYGVAVNATASILYRINPTSGVFTSIYTFTKVYEAFSFKTVPGKLILSAVVKTTTGTIASGTTPVDVTQTFFVFSDPAVGNFTLLSRFDINATVTPVTGSLATDANRYLVDFVVSQGFSKFVTVYKAVGSAADAVRTTLFKSIDWNKATVSDVTFKDSAAFALTSAKLGYANFDLAISENFFVVNTQSTYSAGPPAIVIVEEAYQFVGTVLTQFRQRTIDPATTERTAFKRVFIDSGYNTDLRTIIVTDAATNGYVLTVNGYFNLAAATRLTPPATTPYLTFTIPTGSTAFSGAKGLGWVYKKITALVPAVTGPPAVAAVPASTASSYFRFTPNATASLNVITLTESQTGSVNVLAINDICHIEKNEETPTYKVISRSASTATPPVLTLTAIEVTSLLTGLTLTGTWTLADDCSKFAVDGKVFYRNDAKTAYVLFPNINQVFIALDQNINIAIVGTQVYTIVPSTLTIANVFNYTGTFLSTPKVYSLNSQKVIITSTSANSVQVLAYSVDSTTGAFTNVMTYTDNVYTADPTVYVSPGLTKVLITGLITGAAQKYNAFHVDYTNKQYVNITLPTIAVTTFADLVVGLYDQFLYLKQNFELILSFAKDVSALQIARNNLQATPIADIKRSILFSDPNGKFYFLIVSVTTTTVTVMQRPVSAQQAILNSQVTNAIGSVFIAASLSSTGQLVPCGPGCTECSSGECGDCISGFNFDTNSKICNKCGPRCLTCSSSNFLSCLTCAPGTFKSSTNTCDPCNAACVTCTAGTAADCTNCRPGNSFIGAACTACPRNCLTCSTAVLCSTCVPGFNLGSDNKCSRGCSAFCSTCDPTNITKCLTCGSGLFLLSSKCVACANNCITCSDAYTCSTCVPGMVPNSNSQCVLSCQPPCVTCADNQPAYCLSCYSGSILSGSTCAFDATCNGTGTCTDCGQGLNLYLDASTKKCISCPTITNCVQCSTADYSQCARCASGYFVDSSNTCTQCAATCTSCLSTDVCTSCTSGYTILLSQSSGTCVACTSPCATCYSSATQCLSCVDGYTKKSWKCQKNRYVGFSFVLSGSPTTVLGEIDLFTTAILAAIVETNKDCVTVATVASASTLVTGSVTPSSATATTSATSALLATITSATTIGTSRVSSVSLSLEGQSSASDDKTPLIVGLVVGLTLGVALIVIVIVVIYKKKAASSIGQVSSGELHVEVKDDSLQEAHKAPTGKAH